MNGLNGLSSAEFIREIRIIRCRKNMQYETKILTTKYQKPDAYGALSMPVYYTAAFEFESAKAMGDAFCGRSMAPSYAPRLPI